MLSLKVVPSNCPKLGGDFTSFENPPGGGGGWLGRKGSNLRMLESKSSALPLGDAPAGGEGGPPTRTRIKPAGPARKPAKLPPCQGLGGRLRGRGGIVIRAPPEARGVPSHWFGE